LSLGRRANFEINLQWQLLQWATFLVSRSEHAQTDWPFLAASHYYASLIAKERRRGTSCLFDVLVETFDTSRAVHKNATSRARPHSQQNRGGQPGRQEHMEA